MTDSGQSINMHVRYGHFQPLPYWLLPSAGGRGCRACVRSPCCQSCEIGNNNFPTRNPLPWPPHETHADISSPKETFRNLCLSLNINKHITNNSNSIWGIPATGAPSIFREIKILHPNTKENPCKFSILIHFWGCFLGGGGQKLTCHQKLIMYLQILLQFPNVLLAAFFPFASSRDNVPSQFYAPSPSLALFAVIWTPLLCSTSSSSSFPHLSLQLSISAALANSLVFQIALEISLLPQLQEHGQNKCLKLFV